MNSSKLYKSVFLTLVLIFMTIGVAIKSAPAKQLYNPYTQEYETVQDDNDFNHRDEPQPEYNIEYNPHADEGDRYHYQREGSEMENNPYNGEYEYQK